MIAYASPMEFYNKTVDQLNNQIAVKKKRSSTIAWLRLLVAIIAAIGVCSFWGNTWWYIGIVLLLAISVFLKLVAVAAKINQEIANLQTLLAINQQELFIMQGHYNHRRDGSDLELPHHAYAQDLDIFGNASLFQFIHRTTAEQGHRVLGDWFSHPANEEVIAKRQAAIKDLRDKPEWRQQLQAYGTNNPLTLSM